MTRLAVVLGSVRPNRIGGAVAQWAADGANAVEGVEAEVVDIAAYDLPLFAEPLPTAMSAPQDPAGAKFNADMAEFDAYIIVTPEYNHSITGALKNALDFLEPKTLAFKGVGFVSYSYSGGARPVEHLRQILANYEAGCVNPQVMLSMNTDFVNGVEFKPADFHNGEIESVVNAVVTRTRTLAPLR